MNPLAITLFEQGSILGPVSIKSDYKVNKAGMDYILKHSKNKMTKLYKSMCSKHSRSKFSWFRNLFNGCLRKMKKSTKRFYTEWEHDDYTSNFKNACDKKVSRYRYFKRHRLRRKCMKNFAKRELSRDLKVVPLWRFKDVAQTIYLEHKSKADIFNFYGTPNVFHYGYFKATKQNGVPFVSYFDEGNFSGLGVVDNYKSKNNLRSPASIE